ncbi:choline transporter-like protein [Acrasis kona]|uniref:Choline transporter-like protein n=1 Tax=Acrasis kona TaxID=1008807 RepID=A0AAW2ZGP7_9EUKA
MGSKSSRSDPEECYDSDDGKPEEDAVNGPCGYDTGIHRKEQSGVNHQLTRVKKKRWPTDIPCCVLFVLFVVGMIALGVASFVIGNPTKLYRPTDYLGRRCGEDNSNVAAGVLKIPRDIDCMNANADPKNTTAATLCEDKVKPFKVDLTYQPFLWFMDFSQPTTYGGVCVQYCPSSTNTLPKCPPELNQTSIRLPSLMDTINITLGDYCGFTRADNPTIFPPTNAMQLASTVLSFSSTLNRCVPIIRVNQLSNISSLLNGSTFASNIVQEASFATAQVWSDVSRSWKVLLLSGFVSLFVAFMMLFLIRIFADVVVWGSLLFCGLTISGAAAFMIWQGYTERQSLESKQLSTQLPNVVFYTGIAFAAIAGLYFLIVALFVGRIRNAIGIIKEASKAIAYLPQLVLLPVSLSVLLCLLAAWWIAVSLFLFSYGTPQIVDYAVAYRLSTVTQGVFAYHLFGALWISQFLVALEYMIIASCIASWYWSRKKSLSVLGAPLWRAIIRVIAYHSGTVAFGSLLVAIVQFVRILFEKFVRELEGVHKSGKLVKALVWLVRIILWVFEKIVKTINKNAYIQCAMYGTSFVCAARDAMALILRNPVQMAVVTALANVVMFINKLAIAFLTALFAYAIASKTTFLIDDAANNPINSPILVGFIALLVGFVIGSLFMTILDTAVDTITQCYLIDSEMCVDLNYVPYGTGSLRTYLDRQKKWNSVKYFACRMCFCCDCGGGDGGSVVEAKTPVIAVEENAKPVELNDQ